MREASVTIANITATADSNGHYEIDNLPANLNLQLSASATDFNNFTENVTAVSDANTEIDFTMQAYPGNVTGIVSSTSGGTVSGVNVTIGNLTATTDAGGVYLITGVAAGSNATVTANKQHFASFTGSVNVTSAVNNTYNFTMVANPGNVTGTVTSSAGGTVAGVTVTIANVTGTTDSNGNYTLTGVTPSSNQQVTASKTGFGNYSGNTPVVSDQNTTFNFTMLANPGTVNGAISSSYDGSAVQGAVITIGNVTGTTDSSGEYTLENVPAGNDSVDHNLFAIR